MIFSLAPWEASGPSGHELFPTWQTYSPCVGYNQGVRTTRLGEGTRISLSHQQHNLDGLLRELVGKPEKVKQHREDFLSRWEARAKALAKDEEDLRQGVSTHRRRILGPKKLKVFREILQSLEYDDMEVVDEMVQGCSLVGEVPVTQVLDAKLKPARISVEQLGNMTEAANRAVLEKALSCGD